jgi:hypothetical protein
LRSYLLGGFIACGLRDRVQLVARHQHTPRPIQRDSRPKADDRNELYTPERTPTATE